MTVFLRLGRDRPSWPRARCRLHLPSTLRTGHLPGNVVSTRIPGGVTHRALDDLYEVTEDFGLLGVLGHARDATVDGAQTGGHWLTAPDGVFLARPSGWRRGTLGQATPQGDGRPVPSHRPQPTPSR